ncbi:MAG: Rab family GTPase [Candidatus Hodarchaeota archaeon]
MQNSSENYSREEAIQILFENFAKAIPDTSAIVAISKSNTTIASFLAEGESKDSLEAVSAHLKRVMDRLTRELISGSGPVSFFDTDRNRLIFIRIKEVILAIALKIDGSVDGTLPYAYLTAEKVGHIMEGRPVELHIPLIKIITDEEEQNRVRDHFFELRGAGGTFMFKLIILGDGEVGKTSLIMRHSEDKFKENYLPTLGVSITANSVPLPLRNATVNFSSWDFGGQAYFRRVRLSYYAGAQACLIVFDLTNKKSFENVMKWDAEKKKLAGNIITILVGNKNDLVDQREVTQEDITNFANKHGFTFFETSALTGANVKDVFNLLAYRLVDMEAKKVETKELEELKEELQSIVDEREHVIQFGLIRNKHMFTPILQVFLEMDSNPVIKKGDLVSMYQFKPGIILSSTDLTEKEYFPMQIDKTKDLDGIFGVFDTRVKNIEINIDAFSKFLRILYHHSTNAAFTGSIGILCDKDKYSDYLKKLDISDVLKIPQNSKKSIFFYNLSENYLIEIIDNLKMFLTSFSLL